MRGAIVCLLERRQRVVAGVRSQLLMKCEWFDGKLIFKIITGLVMQGAWALMIHARGGMNWGPRSGLGF
jgi:hypothetical protein